MPKATGSLLTIAALTLCPCSDALAQYCSAESAAPRDREITDSLARRFAPIFEFAPGERYFPTIPFFPAFDAIDRQGPWEPADTIVLAPLDEKRRVSWAALQAAYRRRVRRPRRATPQDSIPIPRSTAVFFRSRCLDQVNSGRIWSFLRNDLQRWDRSGVSYLYRGGLKDATFQSLEYYLYFVHDAGLEGHPHDIEKLFVFVPTKPPPESASERSAPTATSTKDVPDSLLSRLVIIVGAGHSTTTPNNVLVLLGHEAETITNPWAFVELGGHSIAPDFDGDGRFTPGLDINWQLNENVWGVRDLQAVAGTGSIGDYSPEMTLPRSPRTSVYLPRNPRDAFEPTTEPEVQADSATALAKLDSLVLRQPEAASEEAVETLQETIRRAADEHGYLLLPDSILRVLHHAIDIGPGDPASKEVDAERRERVVGAVNRVVRPALDAWNFCGFDRIRPKCRAHDVPIGDDETDLIIRRIAYWALPMSTPKGESKPNRWHPWENREFTDPAPSVLKGHLYRPSAYGVRSFRDFLSLFGVGYGAALGPGGQQLHLSFVAPAQGLGPIEFPGVLELQVGWYRRRFTNSPPDRSAVQASILYERHYKRLFSWYAKASLMDDRPLVELDPLASDFTLGFGASVMPLFPFVEKLPWSFFRSLAEDLRLRAGARIDMRETTPRLSRLELQVVQYFR